MKHSRSDWFGELWMVVVIALILLAGTPSGAAVAEARDPFAGTLFLKGEDGLTLPAVALSTEVEIRVSGLVARARVTQHFHNDTELWLEGVYVFPLPEMAAVERLDLAVGDRRIEGRIQERAQARRTYQRAKRDGKTASLVEQERPNLFTTSVANIGPGEPVEVTIEYQQTLHYDRGAFELRFPMTLTARYVPGGGEPPQPTRRMQFASGTGWSYATWQVPDAPRITPPMLPPGSSVTNPLDLRVVVDAGFPILEIASPSHAIDAEAVGEGRVEVWVHGVPADRDFVLRWVPERGHEPRAALFSEERDGEHYALLMVLPPADETPGESFAREALFVIDTSGSMGGTSIEQARAALRMALDRLGPDDTFNVIAFDSIARPLFFASRPASEPNLRLARHFVDGLSANGGTEMMAALDLALRDDGDDGRLRQVVFITDGSIGNEEALFAAIQQKLGRSRLFMVGIGSAPNAFFLNRAALFGRGTAVSIASQAEVGERMEALFAKIESPVLRDLEIHWNDRVEMWPERVPDLYAGEPVMVTARLRRFVGEVVISGSRGERPFELRLPLTPGEPGRGVHKLWARRKIAHWMALRSAGEDEQRVRKEVLAVALEHQLVSKYTSLVAVDVTPTRPRFAKGVCTTVPNLGPRGFDPSLVPGVLPQGATPAPALLWLGSAAIALAAGLWRSAAVRS